MHKNKYTFEPSFSRRFLFLIFLAWNLPPFVGLGFLIYIQMFTLEQVLGFMSEPWEPAFIMIWVVGSLVYFNSFLEPIRRYLSVDQPSPEIEQAYLQRLHQFPLHFWGLFICYLLLAPSGVIISAELATDFRATPVDWFRIHLVAVVVSIIVGLPLFFKQMDLLGLTLQQTRLKHPVISIKTKVFLLGALMPLLVDTMLVQYYWTRTGYFTYETFGVWFILELLAIGGSLIYLRSLKQSFSPLEGVIAAGQTLSKVSSELLQPKSTDELGTLAGQYQVLVKSMQAHNRLVKTGARLVGQQEVPMIGELLELIVNTCQEAIGGDKVFLILHDAVTEELVGVAQTGEGFCEQGHFRLNMHETSMGAWIFRNATTIAVDDCLQDPRISSRMRQRFGVKSAIGTALISGGKNIGVLVSTNSTRHKHYTREDIALLEDIGSETALVITTYRLLRDREETEQILYQLNQRNELLLESASEGIIGVDRELKCTFANRAAARLLSYTQQDFIGKDMHALIHYRTEEHEPLKRQQLPLYQAISKERSQETDNAILITRNGDDLPVQYSANPIRENGQVTGAVMVFRDTAEARALARQMDYLASHDPLTSLPNRREFELQLDTAIKQTHEKEVTHVLCYLDLDQFKVVNDTCGHQAGDELLRQLASELSGAVRSTDVLARLGGDEFGLLLSSCPMDEALHIADKLRGLVEEYRFAWEGKTFAVGVSIGVVLITREVDSIASVLSAADTACYVAKDSGRNRVHIYEVHDDEMALRRSEMRWVTRINEALDQDRFVLRYQPIVPTHNVDAAGDEAIEILLSMKDAEDGEIPPGAFIPAAERYSLMISLDYWVVENVFSWLRENAQRLQTLQHCFINLSGQSVGQDKFRSFVLEQLKQSGLPAHKICFEITETAAVANMSKAATFMRELKQYGCRFALDDFGSGMSSFSYLKGLPLDYLKIDGNFVRDMAADPIDRAMVQAIHQVGHVMQIKTIAEFVETPEVIDELRSIGVDYAQGFAIARPEALESYLT